MVFSGYIFKGHEKSNVTLQELWNEAKGKWIGFVYSGKHYRVGTKKDLEAWFVDVPTEKQEILTKRAIFCKITKQYIIIYFYRIKED